MQVNSFNTYSAAQNHKAPQFGHVLYQMKTAETKNAGDKLWKASKEIRREVETLVDKMSLGAKTENHYLHEHSAPQIAYNTITTKSPADDKKIVDELKKNANLKDQGVTFFVSA